jgi:hypothetical protein
MESIFRSIILIMTRTKECALRRVIILVAMLLKIARGEQFVINRLLMLIVGSREGLGQVVIMILYFCEERQDQRYLEFNI